LIGFRSTENLPEYADVVVVGCGITGANAARFLTKQNGELDVCVVEAREVCWGATGRVCESLFLSSSLVFVFGFQLLGRC
jgi:ribulose 1,5-bisphosphate synthetase/thiazole synthase